MLRMGLPHESIEGSINMWLVSPENLRHSAIALHADGPIVLFSAPVFAFDDDVEDKVGLFRTLLSLNEELLHAAYGLQGNQILLSGALQSENLDYGEFQAMIDDMSLSLDIHLDRLLKWRPKTTQEAN